MQLPNSHKAVVEIQKLRDYSLNTNHPVGKHKARVFQAALGITVTDAEWLRERAFESAISGDAKVQPPSVFGDKYVIDSILEFGGLSATVRFTWIIEFGTDFPRLTSCYVR
ncbi:MAG TPA: hypothetical protein VK557_19825 [Pyrinomonadaceae bacterium]|nr:hypothetical protein [Pyrinomonadaceae bacterium]